MSLTGYDDVGVTWALRADHTTIRKMLPAMIAALRSDELRRGGFDQDAGGARRMGLGEDAGGESSTVGLSADAGGIVAGGLVAGGIVASGIVAGGVWPGARGEASAAADVGVSR